MSKDMFVQKKMDDAYLSFYVLCKNVASELIWYCCLIVNDSGILCTEGNTDM